jgi:hypothetical protein
MEGIPSHHDFSRNWIEPRHYKDVENSRRHQKEAGARRLTSGAGESP